MAEQTNFYAVQRGAPWSFRPVSDGVINWHLYNFGSNLGVAYVERPSNLWVEMPWNCIFRVKNIVFSSASGGLRPLDPPLWAPYIFTSGFFFFPCAHPCGWDHNVTSIAWWYRAVKGLSNIILHFGGVWGLAPILILHFYTFVWEKMTAWFKTVQVKERWLLDIDNFYGHVRVCMYVCKHIILNQYVCKST